MYSLGEIGNNTFANGAMTADGRLNGLQAFIMQSQEYLQILLADFEDAIQKGYNPNDVKDQIFSRNGINESDLTNSDAQLLISKVEGMYKAYNVTEYYR